MCAYMYILLSTNFHRERIIGGTQQREGEREREKERERERERERGREREQTYSSVHEDIHTPSFDLESIKVGVHWSSNDQIIIAALHAHVHNAKYTCTV